MDPEQMEEILASLKALPNLRGFRAEIDDVDEGDRTVTAIINTNGVDRYRTVIDPRGGSFENFRKNPVVLFNHDAGCAPIGRNLWIKKRSAKGDIIAKTRFGTDDFSDEIFQKYRDEEMRAWSIRFEPDWKHAGPPTDEEIKARRDLKECYCVYRKWELLEYSAVTIGGNADTLTIPNERGLQLPESLLDHYREVTARQAPPAPTPEPTPAPPAAPQLPPLRGYTFDQMQVAFLRQLRDADPKTQARAEADRQLALLRGKV